MMQNGMPSRQSVEDVELALLAQGLYLVRGEDFRGYELSMLRTRLHDFMAAYRLQTVSALQDVVLHDQALSNELVRVLHARSTALFEDIEYQRALRRLMQRDLRSWPAPNIWLSECDSVEEVLSLAILLEEEGLYDRSRIFVTNASQHILDNMMLGRFPMASLDTYEANYRRVGGNASVADYCERQGDTLSIAPRLRRHIVWAQSDLSSDASFNEFQLVVCRHAMKKFGGPLRHRSLRVFDESLSAFGILSVDPETETDLRMVAGRYKTIEPTLGLYRRLG